MTERFQKAYDSLVRAFFEGTLAKFTCTACACGNIILDAVGTPLTREQFEDELYRMTASLNDWNERSDRAMMLNERAESLWAIKRRHTPEGFVAVPYFNDDINKAGYTTEEFAQIENAFEGNTLIKIQLYPQSSEQAILEDQYRGLCAVVDVLLELDNESLGGDKLKDKFREHPKLVTV